MATKIIQIQTNEKFIHILMDSGEIYVKSLDTPDIWKEVEIPILTGKDKNIKSKAELKPSVL